MKARSSNDDTGRLYAVDQTSGTYVGPLYAADEIVQAFDVAEENLAGIRLQIGTYGRRPETQVRLRVREASATHCLREVVLDARSFEDNAWQLFPFPPLAARGQRLTLSIRSEGTGEAAAIALWMNDRAAPCATRNGAPLAGAICFVPRFAIAGETALDAVLFEEGAAPALAKPGAVRQLLRQCLHAEEISFLRLVHLADGVRRARGELGGLQRILSIGAGGGYHEGYLAARMPNVEVVASDWRIGEDPHALSNLRWESRDITTWDEKSDYDLVFSIECLEHIADPVRAFRHMADKVRRRGCFYISVPFASAAEQADPDLRRREWETHEHHRPGFSFADLEAMFTENGFGVVHAANMFHGALSQRVHALLGGLSSEIREAVLGDTVRLLLHDLEGPRAEHRGHATGICMLGRRLD